MVVQERDGILSMKVVPAQLEHCFQVIEMLASDPRAVPLGEISDRFGLQKSATHRLLRALLDLGWVEQMPETGFYKLTLRLAILGQGFLNAIGIPDLTRPILEELAQQTQELVSFSVVEGERLHHMVHAQGRQTGLIYQSELTGKIPLHVTAAGKAWLSTLPVDDAIRIVLEDGFGEQGRFGPNAVKSVEGLIKSLEETRSRGWALSQDESQPDILGIAAVVRPRKDRTVATCSVIGPMMRYDKARIEQHAKLVAKAAADIGRTWPARSS